MRREYIEGGPTVFGGALVGLVDGQPEALVAGASADHRRRGPVEGGPVLGPLVPGLRHGRLQALQGAGLPEAQRRAHGVPVTGL